MIKGSKARKCKQCGKLLFWIVPDKSVLGIQSSRAEHVNDFRFLRYKGEERGRYLCMDCYNKADKTNTVRT